MPTATAPNKTLRQMRDEVGLTAEQAANRVASILGRESYHFSSILKIETQGTRNIDVIRALAKIYGYSIDQIDAVSRRFADNENKA